VVLEQAQSLLEELRSRAYGGNLAPKQRRAIVETLVDSVKVAPWLQGKRPDVKVCYLFESGLLSQRWVDVAQAGMIRHACSRIGGMAGRHL
jgi:hypothetical protein